jgi:gliding motility-associated protein GldE
MDDSSVFLLLSQIQQWPSESYAMLCLMVLLLAASAMFSASEVAFFSLTPQQLDECRKSESPADARIVALISDPKLLLASILILNNLANVGIVIIASYLSWQFLGKNSSATFWTLTVAMSSVIVFFGEVVPKVYAEQRNIQIAKLNSWLLYIASWMLRPFSRALSGAGNAVTKHIKTEVIEVSPNALSQVVEMASASDISSNERLMIKRAVNFGSKVARQIMIDRTNIFSINISSDYHEVLNLINKAGYSRVPVYQGTIDHIMGFLYAKDLIQNLDEKEDFHWQDLIHKEVILVLENQRIDNVFVEFQRRRIHIAIVVDEYGGTVGLITMEDIVEEVVGEINDEIDSDTSTMRYKKVDSAYEFDAKTPLEEVCQVMEVDVSLFDAVRDGNGTLGGLLLSLFKKIPSSGAYISHGGLYFKILAANTKRIKRVSVSHEI